MSWLLFFLTSVPLALADVGDFWSYGSSSAALSGADSSSVTQPYSAYSNPAALDSERIRLGFSLLWMKPSFKKITGVVVENDFNSDLTSPRSDDVDTEYKDTLGQAIGLSLPLKKSWGLAMGAVFYMPLAHAAYIDTGESLIPEYVLYRARLQKPQLDWGWSLKVHESDESRLALGLGVHQAYSLRASAATFLDTLGSKSSHGRLIGTLKTRYTFFAGLHWKISSQFTTGAVYRFAARYPQQTDVDAAGEFIFGTAPNVAFVSRSSLYYDPASFEWGLAYRWGSAQQWESFLLAEYQDWSKMAVPYIEISDQGGSFTITASQNPLYDFRDTWLLRGGQKWQWNEEWSTSLGYCWRQGILARPPSGNGNLLDPDKHSLSLGLSKKIQSILGLPYHGQVDFHAAYQYIVLQNVRKTDLNEAGNPGQKIGAPGYSAGGDVFGGGITLSILL